MKLSTLKNEFENFRNICKGTDACRCPNFDKCMSKSRLFVDANVSQFPRDWSNEDIKKLRVTEEEPCF